MYVILILGSNYYYLLKGYLFYNNLELQLTILIRFCI